jgi:hypothetical protein
MVLGVNRFKSVRNLSILGFESKERLSDYNLWMISNTRIRGKPYPMNQFIGYTEPNHLKMVLGVNRFESV